VTFAPLAASYHSHHVSPRQVAAPERLMKQWRKPRYPGLPAATKKAVYSQSEHLAACNQQHREIAEKFELTVKQRLKRDAELSESHCAT
jgi:hypothetical protein